MRASGIQAQGALGFLAAILLLTGVLPLFDCEVLLVAVSLGSLVWLAVSTALQKEKSLVEQFSIPSIFGAAAIVLLITLYYINPTHRWSEGVGALPVDHLSFLPGSAFPQGTQSVLLFSLSVMAIIALTLRLRKTQRSMLLIGTIIVAAATALWVIGQRVAPGSSPEFPYTGFFTYENHFAAFANLVLPVTLACGMRVRCRAFQQGKVSSPFALFYWFAFLLGLAVAFSRSRAGILITCFIFVALILMQIRICRRYPFASPSPVISGLVGWVLLGSLVIGLIGVAVYFVWTPSGQLEEQMSFRGQVLKDTLSILRQHPWWGTGPGSFAAVFPYYQSQALEPHYFSHAHCDVLEFLSEYGLLGTGVAVVGMSCIFLFRKKRPKQRAQQPSFRELEGSALLLALAGIGLHSLVDFPLHHPLNALLTAVWVGILFRHYSPERLKSEI